MAQEVPSSVLISPPSAVLEPVERKSFETARTVAKPPPLKKRRGLETQLIKDPHPPRLSYTQIRGVAAITPDSPSSPDHIASLRTDQSVLMEMEAFRRDPVWQIEKLSKNTAHRATAWLETIGEAVESVYRWTVTRGLTGMMRFGQEIGALTREAWRSSKALAAQTQGRAPAKQRAGSQVFKTCELRTVPARCMLRVKADDEGMVAVELEANSQVIVFPEYAAKEGWVLTQRPGGEIGFARTEDLTEPA